MDASIQERLERLEMENRRAKWLAALSAAAVVISLASSMLGRVHAQAQASPHTVEAQEFVLKDASGRERADLGVGNDGTTAFVLENSQGKDRLALYVGGNGRTGLGFKDDQGMLRLYLAADTDGTPRLSLGDAQGTPRAELSLRQNGTPRLVLADPLGNPIWAVSCDSTACMAGTATAH